MKEKVSSVEIISKTPISNIAPCQWYWHQELLCTQKGKKQTSSIIEEEQSAALSSTGRIMQLNTVAWSGIQSESVSPFIQPIDGRTRPGQPCPLTTLPQTDMTFFQTFHDVREVGKLGSRCAGLALWNLSLLNQRLKWEGKGKLFFILLSKKRDKGPKEDMSRKSNQSFGQNAKQMFPLEKSVFVVFLL